MLGVVIYFVTVYLKVYKTLKFDYAQMLRLVSDIFPVLCEAIMNPSPGHVRTCPFVHIQKLRNSSL